MLAGLAWRNLWRQPRRTGLSVFSIAFASSLLVVMLSFQLGVYAEMKESALRLFDGYAQFQPHGYADDPDPQKTIADPSALRQEALRIPGIDAATERVNAFAILANGERSFGAAVIGVDPTNELKISSLAKSMSGGRYLRQGDRDDAVLGDVLARNLRLGVGGKVTLLGSAVDGSVAADVLNVRGIYHSGVPEVDRAVMEIPLERAQETFALGHRANTLALSGAALANVQAALPALRTLGDKHGVLLRDWGALEPALRDSITLKYIVSSLFYVVLVIVVAFIILNTLLMSVLERTREFGMLLAIGMRPTLIGRMVWLELLMLALVGTVVGIAIGAGVSAWLAARGISIPGTEQILRQYGLPTELYPSLSPLSVLAGPAAIALAIAIGGIVPYFHVLRLVAARAMRGA